MIIALLHRVRIKPVLLPALFVLFSSGIAYGQDPGNMDSLLNCLETQKKQREYKALALTCSEIGNTLEKSGKTDEALRYYLTGIKIAENTGDKVLESKLKLNLSRLYYYRGELDKAMELDSSARIVFHQAGEYDLEGVAILYISFVYAEMQEYQKALDYNREALAIFRQVKNPQRISQALNEMGTIYQELNDLEMALYYYEQSMAIDDSLGNTEYVAISLSNIAGIYIEQENYQKAIENFEKAYQMLDSTTSFYYLTTITRYMAESYSLVGNHEKAYSTMCLHQSYTDSLNSEVHEEQFLRIQEEFDTEKRENEIHELNEDKKYLSYQLSLSIIIFALSGGIVLLLLLLVFFYMRQRRARDLQKRIELEQKALRVQMNPHFIFNSLNSLQSMFMKGNFDLASDYLGDFGALLRHILENSGKSTISLEEELNTLNLYLGIERMRTDSMIDYEINVDPEIDTRHNFVPPLVIQPFVENAIWHGILPTERKGHIIISISQTNADTLKCVILDNGIGISASRLHKKNVSHKSKGMEITSQRLRKNNDLQIEDLPTGGTQVTIFIPLTHDQSADYR